VKLQQSLDAASVCVRDVDPNESEVEASSTAADGSVQGNAHLVMVDLETGGLEVKRPITQIAAIAVDRRLNELDEFEVKIRFDENAACPDALRRIHYRRAEWKRSAVSPKKAAWAFARFLRQHASVDVLRQDLTTFRVAQLASHNSQFDGPFLTSWFDRLGIFLPASYRVFCTLQRAYWLFHEHPHMPLPDDFRLATLCQYFGVPLNPADAHEAMADARAALAVYRAIVEAQRDLALLTSGSSQGGNPVCT
jgi:DNA polymerase III epsilon subunit-like protein